MKSKITSILFAACIISVMGILSCSEMEPSTYYENFFRVATVKNVEGRIGFYTDYDHQTFYPSNLKDVKAADSVGLKVGDRIKAWFTFDAVGSLDNNVINLVGYEKLTNTLCEGQKPADTLNYYFYFAEYNLTRDILGRDMQYTSYIYPSVWAEGHIVNVAPTYFVPNDDDKAEFHLYPFDVTNDTLLLRLYSDIPTCDVSLNPVYTQTFLNLDISSIRNSADTPAEQQLRDSILARLDRLGKSRIYVKILPPDSARAKNSKNAAGDLNRKTPGVPTTPVSIPFDF